jgi:hypothetical protein
LALEIGTGQSPINEDDSRAKVKAAGLKPVRVQGNVARHLDTLAALISGVVGSKSATEDAYAIVKRLLGLAYFYGGAQNAVEMQVWVTWLLYAVLVDLTDAVAEALNQPFAAISMEMVYRSLYYFTQAYQRSQATDVVAFLATNAKLYGIVKRPRTHRFSQLYGLQIVPWTA